MQNARPGKYECVVCGREVAEINGGTAVQEGVTLSRHKIRDIASVWLRPGDWCPGGGSYPGAVRPPFEPVHPGDPLDPGWYRSYFTINGAVTQPRGQALTQLRIDCDYAAQKYTLDEMRAFWPHTYGPPALTGVWQLPP